MTLPPTPIEPALPAGPPATAEPPPRHRLQPGPEPYACAGDRAYLAGTQDGDFPPMGWHVPGEMGGLWAHPLKLLDGFWFRVQEQPLPRPARFTTHPWGVELEYGLPALGLGLRCRQFIPDGEPALVIELELRAGSGAPGAVRVDWLLAADLRPVWLGERAGLVPGAARAALDPDLGALVITDSANPWCCVAGAAAPGAGDAAAPGAGEAAAPAAWRAGDGVRLPGDGPPGPRRHDGLPAELAYTVPLPAAGAATLTLVVAGGTDGRTAAAAAWRRVAAAPGSLLAAKQARLAALTRRAALTLPDARLTELMDWAKVGFDWLVRRVPGLGAGIGAGLPDYPWWFGTDTAYTAYGLLAAGQPEVALESLRLLARLSNRRTGRIIHEATTAGTVFHPGNTQETPHFIHAAWAAFCWTGDMDFLREVYPQCRQGLWGWTLGVRDPDRDGLPGGGGIMEGTGLAVEALDTVVHTYLALGALRGMAGVLGDAATARRCRAWQPRLAAAIGRFWLPARGLYGDVLATPARMERHLGRWAALAARAGDMERHARAEALLADVRGRTDPGEQPFFLGNWVTCCPLAAGLAPPGRAARALDRLASAEFSSPWGLRVNPWLEPGVMTISTAALVEAELAYGRVEQALALLGRMSGALDHEMPGALAEFLPAGGCFIQAWSGYAVAWPLVGLLMGIRPEAHRRRIRWRPRLPADWEAQLRDLPVGGARFTFRVRGGEYEVSADRPGWHVVLEGPGRRRRLAVATAD